MSCFFLFFFFLSFFLCQNRFLIVNLGLKPSRPELSPLSYQDPDFCSKVCFPIIIANLYHFKTSNRLINQGYLLVHLAQRRQEYVVSGLTKTKSIIHNFPPLVSAWETVMQ